MNRITFWLLSPSTLPKSPPWWTVFLFGAVWNALKEKCMWAAAVCLVGVVLCLVGSYLEKKYLNHRLARLN